MTFQEWLGEIEAWSTRQERLRCEVGTHDYEALIKWLQAAYLVGYDAGKEDDHYEGN